MIPEVAAPGTQGISITCNSNCKKWCPRKVFCCGRAIAEDSDDEGEKPNQKADTTKAKTKRAWSCAIS